MWSSEQPIVGIHHPMSVPIDSRRMHSIGAALTPPERRRLADLCAQRRRQHRPHQIADLIREGLNHLYLDELEMDCEHP